MAEQICPVSVSDFHAPAAVPGAPPLRRTPSRSEPHRRRRRAASPVQAQDVSEAGFERFVQGLWPAAKARGVSRATFEEAFRGVEPDAKIIALTEEAVRIRPADLGLHQRRHLGPAPEARPGDGGRVVEDPGRRRAHLRGPAPGGARRLGHGDQFRQLHRLDLCGPGPRDPGLYRLPGRLLQGGAAHRAPDPGRASISTAPRCWAPGPAPWGRPSSCPRAS